MAWVAIGRVPHRPRSTWRSIFRGSRNDGLTYAWMSECMIAWPLAGMVYWDNCIATCISGISLFMDERDESLLFRSRQPICLQKYRIFNQLILVLSYKHVVCNLQDCCLTQLHLSRGFRIITGREILEQSRRIVCLVMSLLKLTGYRRSYPNQTPCTNK